MGPPKFDEERHEDRFKALFDIGRNLIDILTEHAGHPAGVALELNEDDLAGLVRWHYEKVGDFRNEQGFPVGEFVDYPKVAAFTAIWILRFLPIRIKGDPSDLPFQFAAANAFFARDAFESLIFVRQADIPADEDQMLTRLFVSTHHRYLNYGIDDALWFLLFEYLFPVARWFHLNFIGEWGRRQLAAWNKESRR